MRELQKQGTLGSHVGLLLKVNIQISTSLYMCIMNVCVCAYYVFTHHGSLCIGEYFEDAVVHLLGKC